MHRPSSFPIVQFANASATPASLEPCRNIEHPGRHVAKSIHLAQAAYASAHNGTYAPAFTTLLNASYCNLNLHTSDTCDLDALQFAADHPEIVAVKISITENITKLTRACPNRPCFMASVQVTVPASHHEQNGSDGNATAAAAYTYVVQTNSNRDTTATHPTSQWAPCL